MLEIKRHKVTNGLKAALGLAQELAECVAIVEARAAAVVRLAEWRLLILVLGPVQFETFDPVI